MSAIRCEASSSASLSPAETPSLSASDRFWLTFHLPSIRAISISTVSYTHLTLPTILRV